MALTWTAPGAPSGVTGPETSTLDTIMKLLNSPAGGALISAGGAGLAAYGANKSANANAEANRQMSTQQFAADMAQRQLESDRQNQLAKSSAAANASPLGESQSFAQRQALMGAILPGLRNSSYAPGDSAVASAMGSGGGGMRLPEGGLDPAMISRLFGDDATLASLSQRQGQVGQINPSGPTMDLGSMFGQKGTDATNSILTANHSQMDADSQNQAQQRAAIMRAIDADMSGGNQGPAPDGYEYDKATGQLKKKGSSFLAKLGKGALKVGKYAAPIALAATGVGIPAAIAASAGLNALDTKVNGGSLAQSLISGGIGAATGAIPGAAFGGGLKGVVGQSLGQVAKSQVKNPALYGAILGGVR